MKTDPIAVARKSYQAYVDKDRAAIESVIADDFHFTSPLDNRLDRKTYFKRCWPNSETIAAFEFINLVADGERVFVTYEGQRHKRQRLPQHRDLDGAKWQDIRRRSVFRLDDPA